MCLWWMVMVPLVCRSKVQLFCEILGRQTYFHTGGWAPIWAPVRREAETNISNHQGPSQPGVGIGLSITKGQVAGFFR